MPVDFSDLPTEHPYTLMLSQADTERLLEERLHELGGDVIRPKTLSRINQDATGVTATFDDGETIRARYAVGADGMHSTVRQQAGIGFTGGEFAESFVLADVRVSGEAPRDEVILFYAEDGLNVLAPLPDDIFRIVAPTPDAPPEPSAEFVQELLDTRAFGPVTDAGYATALPDLFFDVPLDGRPRIERLAAGDEEEFRRMGELVASLDDQAILEDTERVVTAVGAHGQWGCVGFCMGGRFGLRAAETFGEDVAAASLLHPSRLVTDEPDSPHLAVDRIDGALYLGLGENDHVTPPDTLAPLRERTRAQPRRSPDRRAPRRRPRLHDAWHALVQRGRRGAGLGGTLAVLGERLR